MKKREEEVEKKMKDKMMKEKVILGPSARQNN